MNAPPQKATGPARSEASTRRQKVTQTVATDPAGGKALVTFVERAKGLINCFCESAQLIRPPGEGAQVELTAAICRNRYVYATVSNDAGGPDDDPTPRIVRFLSREMALIKNPRLADIALQPQEPVVLPVVRDGGCPIHNEKHGARVQG